MHIHTVTYIHIYIYIYTHVYINGLAWSACRSAPVIHGVQVAQVSGETSNEVYLQQWMQAMTRRFGALTRSSLDRRTTPSWSRGDRGCFLCVCVEVRVPCTILKQWIQGGSMDSGLSFQTFHRLSQDFLDMTKRYASTN